MVAMAQFDTSGAFSVVLPTLAAMLFLAALVGLVAALALLFPGPAWIPMWNLNREAYESLHHLGRIAEVFLLGVGSIAAGAAAGLLMHKRWAWWIALLLFAANDAGDLLSIVRTHEIVRFGSGVVIASGFIVLLVLPPVRRSTD
jgi:hypothetical protein